jgi:hypothetical protein
VATDSRVLTLLVPLAALALVCALSQGAPAAAQGSVLSLPGASGPQSQIVGTPPHDNEVVEVFVYETPDQAAVGAVRPQRFRSGVERLKLDVRLKAMPRTGDQVRYELIRPDGPLPMDDGGLVTIAFLTTIGVASMDFELSPQAPSFPDGPYRLTLFMNETPVAVLNWSVGDR